MMVNILCLEAMTKTIIYSIALFGMFYICLKMYIDLIVMRREIEN